MDTSEMDTRSPRRVILLLFRLVSTCCANPHHLMKDTNIWLTWANQTGHTDFCLSLASTADPFKTCLVGIPLSVNETVDKFDGYYNVTQWKKCNCSYVFKEKRNSGECIANLPFAFESCRLQCLIIALNASAIAPIQELDLMASMGPANIANVTHITNCSNMSSAYQAENGTGAVFFGGDGYYFIISSKEPLWQQFMNVTAKMNWWNLTATGGGVWPVNVTGEKSLPPGFFLVCGDHAWPGIPWRPVGGPCYIGQLTIFAPSKAQMIGKFNRTRQKRSILNEKCDDNVKLPSRTEAFFSSFLTPGVMAAWNAANLKKLACWTAKQSNLTSTILSELTTDVDSIHHAVLQNRAAIDFPLLAQGHGCDEFDGMCCFNLSDHSNSIHKQLEHLRDNLNKLKVDNDPFAEWWKSLGFPSWLLGFIKALLVGFLFIIILLGIILCCFSCIQRLCLKIFETIINRSILLAQKGGIVGEWLMEKGHGSRDPLCDESLL